MSAVNSPIESTPSFQVPPFPTYPSVQRYVAVGAQNEALLRVRRAIEAFEAVTLVIGPPGTGKSLIGQLLVKQFAGQREVVQLGDTTIQTPAELMRYVLRRLAKSRGIDLTTIDTSDLQMALMEILEVTHPEIPAMLLLIDEAQSLTPAVLETLRMLTNVMRDGRPGISAVLLGGPKLDETLTLPSLESLVQRIATRCYLHPLNLDETVRYVQSVIRDCGSEPDEAIEPSAIRSIHRACSGVPRLINQLMTAAIDSAAAMNETRITGRIVDHAWSVLQQLPGPMIDEPELSKPAAVEFGPLPDEVAAEHVCSADAIGDGVVDESTLQTYATTTTDWSDECESIPELGTVSFDCGPSGELDVDLNGDEIRTPTPTSEDLFGSFDDEEPLTVVSEPELSDATPQPSVARVPVDLETKLHEEVLSMKAATERSSIKLANHAPLSWIDEDDVDAPSDPSQDDSDLLVIEDDIRVDGGQLINETVPADEAMPAMTVDFHSMLAKMRSPQT